MTDTTDPAVLKAAAKRKAITDGDVLVFAPNGWDNETDALSKLMFAYRDRWEHCKTCDCNTCGSLRYHARAHFQLPLYLVTFSRQHRHRNISWYAIWRGVKLMLWRRRNRGMKPIFW